MKFEFFTAHLHRFVLKGENTWLTDSHVTITAIHSHHFWHLFKYYRRIYSLAINP